MRLTTFGGCNGCLGHDLGGHFSGRRLGEYLGHAVIVEVDRDLVQCTTADNEFRSNWCRAKVAVNSCLARAVSPNSYVVSECSSPATTDARGHSRQIRTSRISNRPLVSLRISISSAPNVACGVSREINEIPAARAGRVRNRSACGRWLATEYAPSALSDLFRPPARVDRDTGQAEAWAGVARHDAARSFPRQAGTREAVLRHG